ncbi:hypothetical protein KKD19_07120 [Patescibacteria group bacterium]|nr:hypothetical protein [Patescibacteria group bacterium]MBU4512975.1 hypothetical protein [Patescibacteria group bacterium]MCG2693011.1 hypothetical protein [Candidatus Parcubacteria bacterium]
MLRLEVYVNFEQIDSLGIVRKKSLGDDKYEYVIRRPVKYAQETIIHKRCEGWKVLAQKALNRMIEIDKKNGR